MLLGASIRPAAQSARRAGLSVTGIDLFGDTDTVAACDRYLAIDAERNSDEIFHACRGIPVIQVGGLHAHDWLIQGLSAVSSSPGGFADAGDRLRDIGYLRQLADKAGMRFPPTYHPPDFARVDRGPDRWLSKPRRGCGGIGVRWYNGRAAGSDLDDHLIQKWIPGRVYGATLLCNGSHAALLGVCRSLFTRQRARSDSALAPFVYCGSLGPFRPALRVVQSLNRLGQQIVATSDYRGPLNVDFVLDESANAWLLEINPRWSGSSELIERQLVDRNQIQHQSLLWQMIRAMEGEHLPPNLAISDLEAEGVAGAGPPVYLKRIVFARRRQRFEMPASDWLRQGESIHDIPPRGTVLRPGDPVCTFIGKIDPGRNDPMRYRAMLRVLSGDDGGGYCSPRSSA